MVSFAIGSYNDEMLCDVLDMKVCHILLGRPWQYAKYSVHNECTNIYTIQHDRKRKELIPLPPCKTMANTTKQNKASCALTKVRCCNKIQKEREPVHLFTKKTHENQNQQQSTALTSVVNKAVELNVTTPLIDDVTELNKLNHESSITCCDVNGFYFINDTIADFSYYCRYHNKQQAEEMVHLQRINKRNSTKTGGDSKQRMLQEGTEIHLNLLNCYGILKACNADDNR